MTDQPSQTPLTLHERMEDARTDMEGCDDSSWANFLETLIRNGSRELETAQTELSAARRDAERYRFIMSGKRFGVIDREGSAMLTYQGTAFDAMIDAAIDAKGGK